MRTHMKTLATVVCILSVAIWCVAADKPTKPKLKVAADGFPSGHDTPEGVACDLARAFINRDVALFTDTCIRPFGGGESRTEYQTFLDGATRSIKEEAAKKEPSPGGPKAINKVFAARHLSKNGPASYGYATFNYQDVMFVDVDALLRNGKHALNRTLVIKNGEGKWYVHPAPTIHALLSMGLNDEAASTRDFSGAYEVEK
jgi:hypothetical protein